MPVVPFLPAIIAGGAAIAGSNASSSAARRATNAQTQVADQNNALQREIYQSNTEHLNPFMTAGVGAQGQEQALLGLGGDPQAANDAFDQFRNSTGYQFQYDQGMDALNGASAAGNRRLSGGALKSAIKYGQGQGANAFGAYYDRLAGLAGRGMNAASALAGVGQGYANSVGANNQNAADARSNNALYQGSNAAALYGGIGNLAAKAFGQSSYARRGNGSGVTYGSGSNYGGAGF